MAQQNLRFINPATLFSPPGFTQVVEVNTPGRLFFIAGQIAADKDFKLVGQDDFAAQATQVFENLKAALAEVGADFTNVIKLNYYLKDTKYMPQLREARDKYVNTANPPASTAVQVGGFAKEGVLLEIEAIASLPN